MPEIYDGYDICPEETDCVRVSLGATLGTLIPFFYYNVFGNPEKQKKIFMGDTGSLTIGIMLAFLTIAVFNIPEDAVSSGSNIFIMAVSPLILPCFDVARVFLHRVNIKS